MKIRACDTEDCSKFSFASEEYYIVIKFPKVSCFYCIFDQEIKRF